jgi:hypothetical protein
MTTKVYTTARGKTVDMGAMRLQNEHVRAVGNMGVNARGDRIDANGQVIDPRQHQLQRQVQRQTNVSDAPVHKSTAEARLAQTTPPVPTVDPIVDPVIKTAVDPIVDPTPAPAADHTDTFVPPEDFDAEPEVSPIEPAAVPAATETETPTTTGNVETAPAAASKSAIPTSGLAGAMAKAKTVKQELEKTARQTQQSQGVRKL